jgi:two-component system, cell cycle response regulator
MAAQPSLLTGRQVLVDPVGRRLVAASVCWLVFYAILTTVAQGSPGMMLFVGDVLYLVPIIAAVVAASMAARRLTGRHRTLWLLLAVAYAAQLSGEGVWAGYDYLTNDGPPQPSIADFGYLSGSVLSIMAVLTGFGGAGRLRTVRGLLDTALIVIGLGGLGWQMLLRPQLSDQVRLADLVSIAYPILDVMLLSCLCIVGMGGHRSVPVAVRLVGAATALNAISDITYTYQAIFADYESGGWLDVMFEAGAVTGFLAAAIAIRFPQPPAERRQFDHGLTLLPVLTAAVATFTLVIFVKVTSGTVDNLSLVIVGVLFLTVMLRQYLFVADRATLADQLRHALREQKRLAVTDGLTGLYNRRHLTEQMARHEAGTAPVSLLIVDLDHFKRINDTFGHPVGDVVLQEAAVRIAAMCRSTDIVARYGGEEFVVLLPETDEDQTWRLAERIRSQIRATPVVDATTSIPISASVGGATRRDGDMRLLMETADRALYRAKADGRDRVAVSTAMAA